MKNVVRAATAGLFLGAVMSPAVAADNYYLLSVDILADDGSVVLHQQVKCPRYDKCINAFSFVAQGKKQILSVKAPVPDDRHIYVRCKPGYDIRR